MSLIPVSSKELIAEIISKKRKFSSLTPLEMSNVSREAIVSSDRPLFLLQIVKENTTVLDYDEKKPYWLDSDFNAPIWILNLSKKPKYIYWNEILLSDGKSLTDEVHRPLLNTFKIWVLATDMPLMNGGHLNKKSTVHSKVLTVLSLINSILMNEHELDLARNHLVLLNHDVIMSIMICYTSYSDIWCMGEVRKMAYPVD